MALELDSKVHAHFSFSQSFLFSNSSINVYKRDVQGVIVMRIDDGNQVVSLERVEKMDEEETGEQA